MKRLGLLGSFALVLAACGGGGGNNSGANCGNGVKEGSEQCDDGNTNSGDGCDSTCRTERSGACGDGTVDVQYEQCDDGNTVSGDGCDSNCVNEGAPSTCGNGQVEGNEQCDDGNTMANDGCSPICRNEVAADGTCADPIMADLQDDGFEVFGELTGTTATGVNGFAAGMCDGMADIGAGKDKTYTIVLAEKGEIYVSDFGGAYTPMMRLTTSPCVAATEVPERLNTDGCTADDFSGLDFYNLPAGTYYLTLDGASAADSGAYDIGVEVLPSGCGDGTLDTSSAEQCDDGNEVDTDGCSNRCFVQPGYDCNHASPSVCASNGCGNGTVAGTEQCDDHNNTAGDGCSPTCHEEVGYSCTGTPSACTTEGPGCGDGIIQTGEECDDSAKAGGDGCSATCMLESDVAETEPNNTTPQILSAGSHRISGSFTADDVDEYKFTLATAAHVEIESYVTIDASRPYTGIGDDRYDCPGTVSDPVMDIYAPGVSPETGSSILNDDDHGAANDGGSGYGCTYIGNHDPVDDTEGDLAAGTYTIKISNHDGELMTRYLIDLRITP
ncbi:MAG TPA: DUF4215 domain-containing protein [Kofleriaceae bacterium]|jgi:cysteine-rich repeat protein